MQSLACRGGRLVCLSQHQAAVARYPKWMTWFLVGQHWRTSSCLVGGFALAVGMHSGTANNYVNKQLFATRTAVTSQDQQHPQRAAWPGQATANAQCIPPLLCGLGARANAGKLCLCLSCPGPDPCIGNASVRRTPLKTMLLRSLTSAGRLLHSARCRGAAERHLLPAVLIWCQQ